MPDVASDAVRLSVTEVEFDMNAPPLMVIAPAGGVVSNVMVSEKVLVHAA